MKSKAHGRKCQAMGVSESSLDEPESEETGTSGNGDASDLFCSGCVEVFVHSWMNFCLWRRTATQHWQLMQHHVLFSSPRPCIRNMKKWEINKWRIQSKARPPDAVDGARPLSSRMILWGKAEHRWALPSAPKWSHRRVSKSARHDSLPCCAGLCRLSFFLTSRSHSSQGRAILHHSQGCRDSLWIEARCFSIKFQPFHSGSIYNVYLMGGRWGVQLPTFVLVHGQCSALFFVFIFTDAARLSVEFLKL